MQGHVWHAYDRTLDSWLPRFQDCGLCLYAVHATETIRIFAADARRKRDTKRQREKGKQGLKSYKRQLRGGKFADGYVGAALFHANIFHPRGSQFCAPTLPAINKFPSIARNDRSSIRASVRRCWNPRCARFKRRTVGYSLEQPNVNFTNFM